MMVELLSYDSFSTRSMATFIKTDISIFIDPSVAIAPQRYNLPPHKIELKELEMAKDKIIEKSKAADIAIITHYHWDHVPRPDQRHFIALRDIKRIYIKDPLNNINNSQKNRARWVLNNLKNNEIIVADSKRLEIDNTYIEFSKPVWHGPKNSIVGKVIMVYIEFKGFSLLFSSDIQGVLVENTKKYIIEYNPDLWILSGPATYHGFWKDDQTMLSNNNIIEILEKTKIKNVIMDHHLVRDIEYEHKIKDLIDIANQIGVKIKTAAEYMNIEKRMLEANRKNLYINYPK